MILKIIALAELKKTDTVVEIGPGEGALTFPLLQKANQVIAIEKDRRLGENLRLQATSYKLKVIIDDALFILPYLQVPKDYKVVSSLPYNIANPVIRLYLEGKEGNPPPPKLMVLVVQKEVAERIVAKEGDSERGVLSLLVQFYGFPKIWGKVPPECFSPRPKVDSAILKIMDISRTRHKIEPKFFFRLVKAGFSHRRKLLKNSLTGGLNLPPGLMAKILKKAGISPLARAQDLSLEDWLKISSPLANQKEAV